MSRALLLCSLAAALASHATQKTDLDEAEKSAAVVLDELSAKYGPDFDKIGMIVLTALPRIQVTNRINGGNATVRAKDRDTFVDGNTVRGKVHPNDLDDIFAWAAEVVGRALVAESKLKPAPVAVTPAAPPS